jgi:hypothetical protein
MEDRLEPKISNEGAPAPAQSWTNAHAAELLALGMVVLLVLLIALRGVCS